MAEISASRTTWKDSQKNAGGASLLICADREVVARPCRIPDDFLCQSYDCSVGRRIATSRDVSPQHLAPATNCGAIRNGITRIRV